MTSDDTDSSINPGATEICDTKDNDCNGGTADGSGETWYEQTTNCGVGECASNGMFICSGGAQADTCVPEESSSEVCDGLDNDCDGVIDNDLTAPLNDLQAGVCSGSTKTCSGAGGWVNDYSGIATYEVTETTCDGLDNDCDGSVDNGVLMTFYQDSDGDTYGNPSVTTQACSAPGGYVADNTDCDDADPNEHPGQTWWKDADDDGYSDQTVDNTSCERPAGYKVSTELTGLETDCDDNDGNTYPGATRVCDGIDNDCDTEVPIDEADADTDGFRICEGDCNDGDSSINPDATEICDGIDNDCDSEVDEGDTDSDGIDDCLDADDDGDGLHGL